MSQNDPVDNLENVAVAVAVADDKEKPVKKKSALRQSGRKSVQQMNKIIRRVKRNRKGFRGFKAGRNSAYASRFTKFLNSCRRKNYAVGQRSDGAQEEDVCKRPADVNDNTVAPKRVRFVDDSATAAGVNEVQDAANDPADVEMMEV